MFRTVNQYLKSGALLLVLSFLFGCQTHSVKPTVEQRPELKAQWASNQTELKAIQSWGITAKASVTSSEGNGTVSLFWSHSGKDNALKIVAPFGRGTFNIQADETQASMMDAQGRRHSAATMKGLVWLKTGLEVPFDDLQEWVLGIAPDPDSPSLVLTPQGQTMGFIHDGWAVRYIDFVQERVNGKTLYLPRKIYLSNPRIEEGLGVKLAVRTWELK